MKILLLLTMGVAGACLAADAPAKKESAFACNRMALGPEARKRHFEQLGPALRGMVRRVREVADGFEFEFPSDAESVKVLAEWVVGERLCCPFFDIALRWEREGGGLWLRLTGREGVKEFIRADFGRWLPQ